MSDEVEIVLRHLSVVRLEPGDVIVFRSPHPLTVEDTVRITEAFEAGFPGHRSLVVSDGLEVSVLRGLTS